MLASRKGKRKVDELFQGQGSMKWRENASYFCFTIRLARVSLCNGYQLGMANHRVEFEIQSLTCKYPQEIYVSTSSSSSYRVQ